MSEAGNSCGIIHREAVSKELMSYEGFQINYIGVACSGNFPILNMMLGGPG